MELQRDWGKPRQVAAAFRYFNHREEQMQVGSSRIYTKQSWETMAAHWSLVSSPYTICAECDRATVGDYLCSPCRALTTD